MARHLPALVSARISTGAWAAASAGVCGLLVGSLALAVGACGATVGERCELDSDCEDGLACSPEAICVTYGELGTYMAEGSFVSEQPEFVSEEDLQKYLQEHGYLPAGSGGSGSGSGGSGGSGGTDGGTDDDPCDDPPLGIFEPSIEPCVAPLESHKVTGLSLLAEGHGLAGMAGVANLAIPTYLEEGTVKIEVWIDGGFTFDCPYVAVFAQTAEDRNADCTVEGATVIEMEFPGITAFNIVDASIAPGTLRIEGLVDKDEMIGNVPGADPTLVSVIESSVVEDVDTDDDGEPDMASIVMTALF